MLQKEITWINAEILEIILLFMFLKHIFYLNTTYRLV